MPVFFISVLLDGLPFGKNSQYSMQALFRQSIYFQQCSECGQRCCRQRIVSPDSIQDLSLRCHSSIISGQFCPECYRKKWTNSKQRKNGAIPKWITKKIRNDDSLLPAMIHYCE